MSSLIKLLSFEEGRVPFVYKCSLGYDTIGVGRLVDRQQGGRLSDAEIDYLLMNDIETHTKELDAALPWARGLDPVRRAVLVSMAFQMGVPRLLQFTQTLPAIRDERWDHAANLMLQSLWAKQTPERAQRHSRQMATGEWQYA